MNSSLSERQMETEQANQRANSNPGSLANEPRVRWGRPLGLIAAVVFCISSAFPVIAGLSKNTASFPKWWGVLDVGIAFVLAILAIVILAIANGRVNKQAEDSSYRTYRVLTHGILAIIAIFFLFGDRITWSNCLTGLAWRAWLLLYSLPAWFTALRGRAGLGGSPEVIIRRRGKAVGDKFNP
jgi:hypothetical protein